MKGLWLENKVVTLRNDLPEPTVNSNEAKLQVLVAGICNTDIELSRGYYPYTGIIGHEFVARVVECPSQPDLVGKRVVGDINITCGECAACTTYNMPTHCSHRNTLGIKNLHGALAQYTKLPVKNLHVVPEEVSDDCAVFTEPLAAAMEIQEQIHITPNDRVLVLGDGKLGQLVAQTIALTGCQLTVLGRHNCKLENLRSRGIYCITLTDKSIFPMELIREFDYAIECTGTKEGLKTAQKSIRCRGTLVLKSTYAGSVTVNMSSIVVDEITLIGSRCGPFGPALALLKDKKVDVSGLIQETFSIDEAINGFDSAKEKGAQKVLIKF